MWIAVRPIARAAVEATFAQHLGQLRLWRAPAGTRAFTLELPTPSIARYGAAQALRVTTRIGVCGPLWGI